MTKETCPEITKERKLYWAYCERLGIFGKGKTPQEAVQKLKNKRIVRNGLVVTVQQLRDTADSLEAEGKESCVYTEGDNLSDTTWEIGIINKEGWSDTWELE